MKDFTAFLSIITDFKWITNGKVNKWFTYTK